VETFNGSLRDECLNVNWFALLEETKRALEAWRRDYNAGRPHSSLKDLSPDEFARTIKALDPA
jgi:putative transposase